MSTATAEPMVTPEVKRKTSRDRALTKLASAAKVTLAEAEAAVASTVHVFKPTQAEIDEAIKKTAKRMANLRPVLEAGAKKPKASKVDAPVKSRKVKATVAAVVKKADAEAFDKLAAKMQPGTPSAKAPKPDVKPAATGICWINGPERQKDGSMVGDYRLRLPGGFEDATGTGWATKAEAAKYAADHGLTVKLRKDVGPSGQSIGQDAAEKPVKQPKVKALAAERKAFGIKPFDAEKAAANGVAVA
jgi:hypothetical protein